MEKYDVVIVGGGHNGLTVAGYLSKAGANVCVLELKEYVGGAVITKELTVPGFKVDPFSTAHIFLQANPLIMNDELELQSKYGLKYIFADPMMAVIFQDDSSMIFHRDVDKTCESIEKISSRDAKAYREFYDLAVPCLDMLLMGMFSPPAPFGDMISMLEKNEEGRNLLLTLLKSAMDILDEWFESESVKLGISKFASEAMVAPREGGSGLYVLALVALAHRFGVAFPEGGSGKLSESLERCIKDMGGTIKTSSPVKSIKIEKGEAKGVILESGEEIIATKAVVSTVNVKQLFSQMVGEKDLPSNFLTKVERLKPSSFTAINQQFAINEAPKYKAKEDGIEQTFFMEIVPSMDNYLKEFDEFLYGIPGTKSPLIICSTILDPSRAPEGKHTLYLYHFEPYHIKGDAEKWDQIKEEVADGVLQTLRDHTTNMGDDNILGRYIVTPLDLERYNPSWIEGDFGHIGSFLFQSLSNRPIIGWSNYKTPIEKLYMAGPSTHPGLGVIAGGRAAVQVVMDDLGLDFKQFMK